MLEVLVVVISVPAGLAFSEVLLPLVFFGDAYHFLQFLGVFSGRLHEVGLEGLGYALPTFWFRSLVCAFTASSSMYSFDNPPKSVILIINSTKQF